MTDAVLIEAEGGLLVVQEPVAPQVVEIVERGLRGEKGDKGDVGDVNPDMPIILAAAEAARDAAADSASIATAKAAEAVDAAEALDAAVEAAQDAAAAAQASESAASGSADAAQADAAIAQAQAAIATTKADEAANSAADASLDAVASLGHRTAAEAAQAASEAAQGIAEGAATDAGTQAGIATTKAEETNASAIAAAADRVAAEAAAGQAADAADTADAAASTAVGAASAAVAAADVAEGHAATAATDAATATTKAGEADSSAISASADAARAEEWAEAEGEVEPGRRSAKHWAGVAQDAAATASAPVAAHESAADPHTQYVQKVTGKGLSEADFTDAEKTKLAGIAENATANASDADLRDRATHTGTQAISTVSGLQDALDAKATSSALGTAAAANLTTSATDTTAGRVLKVGDFGLGMSAWDTPQNVDLNTLTTSGLYLVASGSPNIPPNFSASFLWVSGNRNGAVVQLAFDYNTSGTTPMMAIRRLRSGVWGSWSDFHTTQGVGSIAVPALNIDCSAGDSFTKTIAENSTFTFSNAPSSRAYSFTLEVTHTSGTITWPASVKWPFDQTPTLTAGRTHIFMFSTRNGGTRWRGAVLPDYVN